MSLDALVSKRRGKADPTAIRPAAAARRELPHSNRSARTHRQQPEGTVSAWRAEKNAVALLLRKQPDSAGCCSVYVFRGSRLWRPGHLMHADTGARFMCIMPPWLPVRYPRGPNVEIVTGGACSVFLAFGQSRVRPVRCTNALDAAVSFHT